MKKFILFTSPLLLFTYLNSFAFSKEVAFTQEDRDRLILLEEGQKAVSQRIDDLRDIIYAVLGGIIALIVFVILDRRTALCPVAEKTRELDERQDTVEKVFKEFARKD